MDKRFAIFDMDGTLVDSMRFWRSLGKEYLRDQGITENTEDVLEKIKPMTMTQSSEFFRTTYGLSATKEEIAEQMNETMDRHYRMDVPLKDGVKEYLEKLAEEGVKMCVASATAEPLMRECLERLGVIDRFEFLLSCEEVGTGKHAPDVYFESIKRLGSRPEETAVYEDALYAVKTAKDAGFYVVGVFDESSQRHWDEICSISDETVLKWK